MKKRRVLGWKGRGKDDKKEGVGKRGREGKGW